MIITNSGGGGDDSEGTWGGVGASDIIRDRGGGAFLGIVLLT